MRLPRRATRSTAVGIARATARGVTLRGAARGVTQRAAECGVILRGAERGITQRAAERGVTLRGAERGVTLMETLIVVALIAIIGAVSYPSVTAGLDALRMRQTSDQVVKFLSAALDRADRKQQVVELVIAPEQASMVARSEDLSFNQALLLPAPFRIGSTLPALPMGAPNQERHFLIYPGGAVPRLAIEIVHPAGRRRVVTTDPLTGTAQAQ